MLTDYVRKRDAVSDSTEIGKESKACDLVNEIARSPSLVGSPEEEYSRNGNCQTIIDQTGIYDRMLYILVM